MGKYTWANCFHGIIWGYLFLVFKINIGSLPIPIIMSLIGSMLLLYGIWVVAGENNHLRKALLISKIFCIYQLVYILIQCSPLYEYISSLWILNTAIEFGFPFIIFSLIHNGLKLIVPDDQELHRALDINLFIMVANFLILFIGVFNPMIVWVILFLYLLFTIIFVRNLLRAKQKFIQLNYSIQDKSLRNFRIFILILLGIVLLFVPVTMYFSNQDKITEVQNNEMKDQEIIEKMLTVGFPQEIIDDLLPEEIEHYRNVESMKVITWESNLQSENATLKATTYCSYFPIVNENTSNSRILVFFEWLEEPVNRYSDTLYLDIADNLLSVSDFDGVSIYNKDKKKVYYNFIRDFEPVTVSSLLGFNEKYALVVKIPREGDKFRFYFAGDFFWTDEIATGFTIDYHHTDSFWNFPYERLRNLNEMNIDYSSFTQFNIQIMP